MKTGINVPIPRERSQYPSLFSTWVLQLHPGTQTMSSSQQFSSWGQPRLAKTKCTLLTLSLTESLTSNLFMFLPFSETFSNLLDMRPSLLLQSRTLVCHILCYIHLESLSKDNFSSMALAMASLWWHLAMASPSLPHWKWATGVWRFWLSLSPVTKGSALTSGQPALPTAAAHCDAGCSNKLFCTSSSSTAWDSNK